MPASSASVPFPEASVTTLFRAISNGLDWGDAANLLQMQPGSNLLRLNGRTCWGSFWARWRAESGAGVALFDRFGFSPTSKHV